jgi:hypothetical protein
MMSLDGILINALSPENTVIGNAYGVAIFHSTLITIPQ